MDNLSSGSTITTSTLCAKDDNSEKDLQHDSAIKDGRLSTEHQIELNGMCIAVDLLVLKIVQTPFSFQYLPLNQS
jgi:hypothetical protein